MQILQLVSNQNDTSLGAIKCKEENIDDTQKVWMDAVQEKQLADILDETKGWKKLARHLNFENLFNNFEESSSSSTLLLLNYIAVRFFIFFVERFMCIILFFVMNACILTEINIIKLCIYNLLYNLLFCRYKPIYLSVNCKIYYKA